MRCIRIGFSGYKRLLATGCNVDDRLVAFVGPNEAGKTSVLKALAWIDAPEGSALPSSLASRGQEYTTRQNVDSIACAIYRLEREDWDSLSHIAYRPTTETYRYTYSRTREGKRYHDLSPRLRRHPAPFDAASKALTRAPKALEKLLAASDQEHDGDSEPNARALHRETLSLLAHPDDNVTASQISDLRRFAEWLKDADPSSGQAAIKEAADRLVKVAGLLETDHPNDQVLKILDKKRPRFREFEPADRDLESEFDINQEDDAASPPLRRLLVMAETTVEHLNGVWGDESDRDTYLEECNERLSDVFSKAWSQSNLTVRLKAEQHLLKIQVKVVENDRTYYSTFGERSEGLKAFVALVGFLHALTDDKPPILLIDEAETHLHLDAQADLIQVLQDKVSAKQIFYTTHSPGCLPLDLGRGLRFVEPTQEHYASKITHNFWDSRHPGFSAVLFKMGAAAFAFSALRNAVLAEGPSDMILLPTLIKLAIQADTLPYQIAPRLDDLDEDEVRRDVAANVAYLTDGDQGGRDKRKYLKRKRVPGRLVVAHPSGYAVEDYVDPAQLLETINDLRTDSKGSERVKLGDLPAGTTIGQRIDKWFEPRDIKGPGKTAIATRLANMGEDLRLCPGSKSKLLKLHKDIVRALDSRSEQQESR